MQSNHSYRLKWGWRIGECWATHVVGLEQFYIFIYFIIYIKFKESVFRCCMLNFQRVICCFIVCGHTKNGWLNGFLLLCLTFIYQCSESGPVSIVAIHIWKITSLHYTATYQWTNRLYVPKSFLCPQNVHNIKDLVRKVKNLWVEYN